jgi:hypothetical protein
MRQGKLTDNSSFEEISDFITECASDIRSFMEEDGDNSFGITKYYKITEKNSPIGEDVHETDFDEIKELEENGCLIVTYNGSPKIEFAFTYLKKRQF